MLAVEAARECKGTPFKHQGRLPGIALDCAGLVVHVLTRLGKEFTDLRGYPPLPYRHMLENHLDQQPCLRRIRELAPGAVVLLRIKHHPQHLGIWSDRDTLIHAYSDTGRVVENRMNADWRHRISRIYEIV